MYACILLFFRRTYLLFYNRLVVVDTKYPVVFFVKRYLLFVLCIGKRLQLFHFCTKKTLGNNKTGCEDGNRMRAPPGGQSRHMTFDIRIWTYL